MDSDCTEKQMEGERERSERSRAGKNDESLLQVLVSYQLWAQSYYNEKSQALCLSMFPDCLRLMGFMTHQLRI